VHGGQSTPLTDAAKLATDDAPVQAGLTPTLPGSAYLDVSTAPGLSPATATSRNCESCARADLGAGGSSGKMTIEFHRPYARRKMQGDSSVGVKAVSTWCPLLVRESHGPTSPRAKRAEYASRQLSRPPGQEGHDCESLQ
jgi:hypothetical protein